MCESAQSTLTGVWPGCSDRPTSFEWTTHCCPGSIANLDIASVSDSCGGITYFLTVLLQQCVATNRLQKGEQGETSLRSQTVGADKTFSPLPQWGTGALLVEMGGAGQRNAWRKTCPKKT